MSVTLDPNDTIAALATPAGPAARGVVRLSGANAWSIVLSNFVARVPRSLPKHPELRAGSLNVDGLRVLLPVTLALWPAPRTYTGQAIVEIHMVGAAPLLGVVLAHCLARGARLAEPGEFTLRAFLAGRIDLTRAEAVLGVIDAENRSQLDAALAQLAGGLSGPVARLQDQLLDVVAHLEADLDFTEEPDVTPIARGELADRLDGYAAELLDFASRLDDRERGDHHPRVVLTGKPNAGKSQLFNALVGRHAAIVSPQAGTTRDYLSALCVCEGLTIELIDTAGAEPAFNSITEQAQFHRADQLAVADLILHCIPADAAIESSVEGRDNPRELTIFTKCDLAAHASRDGLHTSAVTSVGLEPLRQAIAACLRQQTSGRHMPLGTAARCRGSIQNALAAIQSASDTLHAGLGEELVAAELRLAMDQLGTVVGSVVTDDILDRIFSRFCIGK